jgi:cobyrinic acid a,c-diamide synthase
MRAFVIAGTHSGCGKTTMTMGILAALAKKGFSVQPFKTGPDFIDSGLHKLATGRVSRNLDLWMCGEDYVKVCFERHSSGADVAVIEGVMGLYDGNLSTASLAQALDLPVILVVDAYGMAESAGPIVKGFRDWGLKEGECESLLKGVIFNRIASTHHYERICAAVQDVPVLGYLPRDTHFEIPHRHLGLVVAEEEPVSARNLDRLAETILNHVDIDRLLDLTEKPLMGSASPTRPTTPTRARSTARIAVAADRAFCFYYQDNIDLLKDAGAEVIFFSPLIDIQLPADIDGIYLGGGYPELHAAQLSENGSMRTAIKAWADSGGGIYAECGGLMYLSKNIRDFDNHIFAMAGVFPFNTVMTRGKAHLGYREVRLKQDCILGAAGEQVRGHEFHYSAIEGRDQVLSEQTYHVKNGSGADLNGEGFCYKATLASYIHIHFGSNPLIAPSFIDFATKGRVS